MTKQKPNEREDLAYEYNNRRRWVSVRMDKNESLQKAFPRYAEKNWSVADLKRKLRDLNFFFKD